MKERAPAFQFYPRQFAADDHVMAMDLDAVGAHILLMCAAAASPERCRIHADERAIRTRLRNPSEQDWQRIKSQLLGTAWKPSADGQWWEQHGLRRTFEKQKEFSDQQRERAAARWSKTEVEASPQECRTNPARMPDSSPERCSSSPSSSSNLFISSESTDSDEKAPLVPTTADQDAALQLVWRYYVEKVGRNLKTYSFTAMRKRKGMARLQECLKKTKGVVDSAVGLMKVCIDAIAASDFHMGRDPKTNGKKYCEWEDHLFRSYEQMEKWWNA